MNFTEVLYEPVQAHKALMGAWPQAKAELMAGKRLSFSIKSDARKDAQNRHFHALISKISDKIGGDLANREDAKRILISAFRIDTVKDPALAGEWAKFGDIRMGRGLRGEVVLLGIQSRDFSVRLSAAFIGWLYAFGAECGVDFADYDVMGVGYGR